MGKKMFSKLSFLLAVVMVMTSLCVPAMAEKKSGAVSLLAVGDEFTEGNYDYEITDETVVKLIRSKEAKIEDPVIPTTVLHDGVMYTIEKVAYGAFQNNTALTGKLNIQGGKSESEPIRVEENAFAGCTGLKTVIVGPHTVNTNEPPFSGCTNLQKITNNSESWITDTTATAVIIPEIENVGTGENYKWYDITDTEKKTAISQVDKGHTAVREDYLVKSGKVLFMDYTMNNGKKEWYALTDEDGEDYDQTVREGGDVKEPESLGESEDGFEHVGWCRDEGCTIDWNFDDPVEGDYFVYDDDNGEYVFMLFAKREKNGSEEIKISEDKKELEIGKSFDIHLENEAGETVAIDGDVKISEEGIVEVKEAEDGKKVTVTALAEDTVDVILPHNGTDYKCTVTVKKGSGGNEDVKGEVKISDTEIVVGVGRYKDVYLYDEDGKRVPTDGCAQNSEAFRATENDDGSVRVVGEEDEDAGEVYLYYNDTKYTCKVTVKEGSTEGELYAPANWEKDWNYELYDNSDHLLQWIGGVPDFSGITDGKIVLQKYKGSAKKVVVPGVALCYGGTFKTVVWDATMLGHSDGKDNIEEMDFRNVDFSQATGFDGAFEYMKYLKKITLGKGNNLKTSDAQGMFQGCQSLIEVNFNELQFPNVKNVDKMFQDCTSLQTLDLSKLDFSKVNRAYYFMHNCRSLQVFYSPKYSPEAFDLPFPFTLYNNNEAYDTLPRNLDVSKRFTRNKEDSVEDISDDSVSGNIIKEVKEETRGSFSITYAHKVPFCGKYKLTPQDMKLTVSYNGKSYDVTKAKINTKKKTIQVKKVDGLDKKDLKELKKALKASPLTFEIVPYVVSTMDKVEYKTNKKGVLKKVTIEIFQKKYKAKKGEYSYDSPTNSIIFNGTNLNGFWTVH